MINQANPISLGSSLPKIKPTPTTLSTQIDSVNDVSNKTLDLAATNLITEPLTAPSAALLAATLIPNTTTQVQDQVPAPAPAPAPAPVPAPEEKLAAPSSFIINPDLAKLKIGDKFIPSEGLPKTNELSIKVGDTIVKGDLKGTITYNTTDKDGGKITIKTDQDGKVTEIKKERPFIPVQEKDIPTKVGDKFSPELENTEYKDIFYVKGTSILASKDEKGQIRYTYPEKEDNNNPIVGRTFLEVITKDGIVTGIYTRKRSDFRRR